jgi:hypothetical protein
MAEHPVNAMMSLSMPNATPEQRGKFSNIL